MPRPLRIGLFLCMLLATCVAGAAENQWPQFRGPAALGTADNPDLPDTWSATENVAWKHEIPGRGWSSPILWGDRVFVTTVTNDEDLKDKDRKARPLSGRKPQRAFEERAPMARAMSRH